jgi:hypothetical protein
MRMLIVGGLVPRIQARRARPGRYLAVRRFADANGAGPVVSTPLVTA